MGIDDVVVLILLFVVVSAMFPIFSLHNGVSHIHASTKMPDSGMTRSEHPKIISLPSMQFLFHVTLPLILSTNDLKITNEVVAVTVERDC